MASDTYSMLQEAGMNSDQKTIWEVELFILGTEDLKIKNPKAKMKNRVDVNCMAVLLNICANIQAVFHGCASVAIYMMLPALDT